MINRLSRFSLVLLLSASLAACATADAPAPGDSVRPLAAEDEFCGGIAGIACADGLVCEYDGDYPDAGGTCVSD